MAGYRRVTGEPLTDISYLKKERYGITVTNYRIIDEFPYLVEGNRAIAKTTPEHTTIIFEDIKKENWAIGGVLSSERG